MQSPTTKLLLGLALALGLSACPGEPPATFADAAPEDAAVGPELPDAALPPGPDASSPAPDAGPPGADAETSLDGGDTQADAAVQPADATPHPSDAGAPGGDTGPRPYEQLESLRDDALKTALYDLVKGHTALDYDDGSKVVMTDPGGFDVVDGKVECIYSGLQFDPSQRDVEGGFNMEHSWPKSDGAGSMPAESDMNHLFPSERDINNARASYYFGDTDCTTDCLYQAGGSKLGIAAGSTTLRVFQVRPERQGDIARAHFYFAVRYQMYIPDSEEAALRRWNVADPPDDRERARALAIEVWQKKRNPFVERPDFVDLIADF